MLLHDTVPVHVKGPPTTVGAHEILTSVALLFLQYIYIEPPTSNVWTQCAFSTAPQSRSELYSHLNV